MDYICDICGAVFEKERGLWGHKASHLPKAEHICQYCGEKFFTTEAAFNHHITQKHINVDQDGNPLTDFNKPINELCCQYCKRSCKNMNSLVNHERYCKDNPNAIKRTYPFRKPTDRRSTDRRLGHTPWNKGLTKETNEIIRRNANDYKEKLALGIYVSNGGHAKTEEEELDRRNKLSQIAKEKNNFWKYKRKRIVEYNGFKFDSSYEVVVAKSLDDNNIKWEKPSSFPYTFNDKEHTYTPDFYLPDYDIFLDPKNDFLIKEVNPGTGYKDTDKIKAVELQNNIRVIILDKDNLEWGNIQEKIKEKTRNQY